MSSMASFYAFRKFTAIVVPLQVGRYTGMFGLLTMQTHICLDVNLNTFLPVSTHDHDAYEKLTQ